MTSYLEPGAGIIFMKVGIHAGESLERIIERKRNEIEHHGFALWGYGGQTCHPTGMVQPFAKRFIEAGKPLIMCMHRMNSNHYAAQVRAAEMSEDGLNWQTIPKGIDVMGSRFALCIESLEGVDFKLGLQNTEVAVGPNRGRPGDQYVQYQVDKACLEVTGDVLTQSSQDTSMDIGLTANLRPPYAVFVKN